MTDAHDPSTDLTDEDRCWPCTVANLAVALLVAMVPLAAAVRRGDPALIAIAVAWGVAVVAYALYRLVERGYLPYAGVVARWTGLHRRFGPKKEADEED